MLLRSGVIKVLKESIKNKTAKVLIIGGGYVGLPLSVQCAKSGYRTTIFDLDENKVDKINEGTSYIGDVPSSYLSKLVKSNMLNAVKKYNLHDLEVDIILVCVPTPLNKTKDPDVSSALNAAETIYGTLLSIKNEQLVILESTVYPTFTSGPFTELLEDYEPQKPLIAFSPERIDPSNPTYNVYNTPKVVGGTTQEATEVATAFYKNVVETVIPASSAEVAEMTKILENTFRMINIGLVNEIAIACQKLDINVWEVIEAASTKPFGFMKFTPGPGCGGHCISQDPHYLAWKLKTLKFNSKFIALAEEINSQMPIFVLNLISSALNKIKKPINGSTVLVVGVAYKPDIDDVRESPALDLIELLHQEGAETLYYDPYVEKIWTPRGDMYSMVKEEFELCTELNQSFDCSVITTNHSNIDYNMILNSSKVVVDTRNAYKGVDSNKIVRL